MLSKDNGDNGRWLLEVLVGDRAVDSEQGGPNLVEEEVVEEEAVVDELWWGKGKNGSSESDGTESGTL